jgi:hypothetical protein
MVFNQQATAKTFAENLYLFCKGAISPEVENDIITPSKRFYNSGYEILPVIRKILKSLHFMIWTTMIPPTKPLAE